MFQSRFLPDRLDFQRKLLALVESADTLLPPGEVASRFVVTAYDFLVALESALERGRFRMGVGFGGLATDLKPVCLGMDGPACHRARAALQECKDSGHTLTFPALWASAGRPWPRP